jgi:secreted trypsin-like serine protease
MYLLFGFLVLSSCYGGANQSLPQLKVHGGNDVAQFEYDDYFGFLVSVQYYTVFNPGRRLHYCTGTFIHPRFVLTAAHCAENFPTSSVVVGATDINDSTHRRTYTVKKIHIHPSYSEELNEEGNVVNMVADTALYELVDEVPKQAIAAVMGINYPRQAISNLNALFIGWGRTCPDAQMGDSNCYPSILQKADSTVYERGYFTPYCSKFSSQLSPGFICGVGMNQGVNNTHSGICSGDSGGPLLIKDNGRMVQVGIASFSNCDAGWAAYQSTWESGPWITSVIYKS